MKKYIFLSLVLLMVVKLKAQMPVTDIGVAASVYKQIKAVEQSTSVLTQSQEHLSKVKETLEKTNEYLSKVSNVIRKVGYINKAQILMARAIKAQKKTNQLIHQVYGNMSPRKIGSFLVHSQNLISALTEDITLIEDILKEGSVRMSDFERMTYLDKKLEKIELKTLRMESQTKRLKDMHSMEQMFNRMK